MKIQTTSSNYIFHLLLDMFTRDELKVLIISHDLRQGECYHYQPEHAQHH